MITYVTPANMGRNLLVHTNPSVLDCFAWTDYFTSTNIGHNLLVHTRPPIVGLFCGFKSRVLCCSHRQGT